MLILLLTIYFGIGLAMAMVLVITDPHKRASGVALNGLLALIGQE